MTGGFMGYDNDLVGCLLDAMRRAETELAGVRIGDPDAGHVGQRIAAVQVCLRDNWIPFARGLTSCEVMSGYTPTTIADDDLVNCLLGTMIADRGWRTSTDALTENRRALTDHEATELALWLAGHDGRFDEEQLKFLRSRLLQISASSSLSSSFMTGLTADGPTATGMASTGLASLVDRLGGARTDLMIKNVGGGLSEQQWNEVADIDGAVENLGEVVLGDRAARGTRSQVGDLLAGMEPYGAALLAQHLGLDADELATVAVSLIAREQLDLTTDAYACGIRAADVLMTTVLATANGPGRFVVAAAGAPGLLVASAFDPRISNQILIEGTTPGVLSIAEQALAIPPIVDFVIAVTSRPVEPYADRNPEIFTVTATMLTPYLLQYFTDPGNPFRLSRDRQQRAWEFISDNPAMLDYFVDGRDHLIATLDRPHGSDLKSDISALTAMSETLGLLDGLYQRREVNVADHDRAQWDLWWDIAGLVPGALPASGLTKAGVNLTEIGLRSMLESNGWGPADAERVRLDALGDSETRLAILASVAVCSTFDTFVADGRIPAQPAPPVPDVDSPDVGLEYLTALHDWAANAELDDASIAWLLLAATTFVGPHELAVNRAAELSTDEEQD